MTEYRYTTADRKVQLEDLSAALRALIPVVASLPEFRFRAADYEVALQTCEALLRDGFTQQQLSALGRSVPDVFFRHKEWCPPAEQTADGAWREPAWFTQLEARLQPVLKAAEALYCLGYY